MKKQKKWLIPAFIIFIYLLTHLYKLVSLPVFADEAIYIRWTQLIIDDWRRYLFFPMNDGKTPLLMWLMVPFQFLFSDQLYAARFVSVLIGLGQVLSLGYLVKVLGGKKETSWLAMLLGSSLPFWFFHHRMALTDGLLTLGMTLTIIGVIKIITTKKPMFWTTLTALFLGMSLWSKLPAVLLVPSLFIYPLIEKKKWSAYKLPLMQTGLAVMGGMLLFLILKITPVFSQIFARGSDFLYPWQEVILGGKWQETLISIPNYIVYFGAYLTWPVLALTIIGQFLPHQKKQWLQHILLLSALLFVGPIALLGKVVYPRYLFPASIFLTTSAALTLEELYSLSLSKISAWKKYGLKIFLGLVAGCITLNSAIFIYSALTDVAQIPFVSADKEQYLDKWSAGFGITQSVSLIKQLSQDKTVAVATEGSFGTLPDGLLLYFHRRDVSHLYIEGIGYPVKKIPQKFKDRAPNYDQVILIVNSNRLEMPLHSSTLLGEYCRPHQAPCLQVWDITALLKNN